jgi:cytochrome c oxidase cbb3-type subunit 3
MKTNSLLLACFLVIISLGLSASPDGEKLYQQHCESCHQTHGEGGIGLPLSNIKMAHVSDNYLENTIRLGRPGRIMPAYPGMSDAQVEAIIRYIRSWSDQPVKIFSSETIAGDIANGEQHYKKRCAKCHANDGSGEGEGTGVTKSRKRKFLIMPAAINNSGYLDSVTDQEIREIIIAERDDSKMPSMQGELTDQEINDVVAYVRSLKVAKPAYEEYLNEKPELSIIVESPNDFEATVDAARQALSASNFRLFPERYLEQGLIDEFTHNTRQVSLRFCNFKELYKMMKIEPRLGVLLPCRITIIEKPDKSVLIVAPNMKLMSSWFNNDELFKVAEEMEENLGNAIEEATF